MKDINNINHASDRISQKKARTKNVLSGMLLASTIAASPAHAVIVTPDLEVFTVSSVGNTFQTVNLQNTYTNAIPVCTYNLVSSASVPAAVRITNITANSFDVRIQNPTNGDVTGAVEQIDLHRIHIGQQFVSMGQQRTQAVKSFRLHFVAA